MTRYVNQRDTNRELLRNRAAIIFCMPLIFIVSGALSVTGQDQASSRRGVDQVAAQLPLVTGEAGNQLTRKEIGSFIAGQIVQPFGSEGDRTSFTNRAAGGNTDLVTVFHQPLVQVKVRVAQIVRDDALQSATILDYISNEGQNSLINGNNFNQNRRRTSAATRFPVPTSLLGVDQMGSGLLANLTADNINYIASLLATEFNADLVTCPQVVTLNGQKVTFTSGDKVPFQLGQSVLHDSTLANQRIFYKHVGTFLEITPRIVNWGAYGEGQGKKPVTVGDIRDWNKLAKLVVTEKFYGPGTNGDDLARFERYANSGVLIRSEDQRQLLRWLNEFSIGEMAHFLEQRLAVNPAYPFLYDEIFHPIERVEIGENGCPCDWRPEDCTVDVELLLRQSNQSAVNGSAIRAADPDSSRPTLDEGAQEEVGAAVATVVQLKSGHGALIAGLIGERDVEEVAKVPVVGDIPIVGQLFRSRSTNRQKTETLVFLEVKILHYDPHIQREEAASDFCLGRQYVEGGVQDSGLNEGLRRAGFGSYLPPRSASEHIYWERVGQKIRRGTTAIKDVVK